MSLAPVKTAYTQQNMIDSRSEIYSQLQIVNFKFKEKVE